MIEIIFLCLSASLSGCNTWELIEEFGLNKLEWLRKFFPYKNGTPSDDTLGRFFSILDQKKAEECFTNFVQTLATENSRLVNIDGKTIRGVASKKSTTLMHIVTAYCKNNKICLGQEIVEDKSNEIVAIPTLLDSLSIEGCIVSIDAMGCQKKIAEKIIENKADYILQVKDNQKSMSEQVVKLFDSKIDRTSNVNYDMGHGRVETRKCEIITDLQFLDEKEQWKNLNTIVKISSTICEKKTNKECSYERYYISSAKETALQFNTDIRDHWSIENNLHWCLDVIFKEDNALKRKGNSSQNFNMISKTALALLEADKSQNKSKTKKRFKAAISDEYRELLLKV